ncbi:hypothetical protein DUI87_25340 [Hirundo rustica rustica]|uniref:Methyltransferase domain-containing protein n=1 Tax=Hirundo rustica rustica TaxID=333673 RepID=A0A3M0JAB8_HIRRU|nr:hypothetical protein DUI87_25340 [Hirundo rustica rustica]
MTFGAGGHTRALLEKASDITVYALDRDPTAYEIAQQLSKAYPKDELCIAIDPLSPQPVALVVAAKVQNAALGLVKFQVVGLGLSIQPVQVPLWSPPTFQQIGTPSQLGDICKITDGGLNVIIQIINKDLKQDWAQH